MPATPARKRPRETTQSAATTPISTIMSRNVTSVRSGTSLDVLAELLLARGLSRVPVLDVNGRLIGIVSKTDLVKQTHEAGDTLEESPLDASLADVRGLHVHGEGATVDDLMSQPVTAVGESTSIQRAAQLMVGSQVHGLPVVTGSGELTGFVSTMDILAWLSGVR